MLGKVLGFLGKGVAGKITASVGVTAVLTTSVVVTSSVINPSGGEGSSSSRQQQEQQQSGGGQLPLVDNGEEINYLTGDLDITAIPAPPAWERTRQYRLPAEPASSSTSADQSETEAADTMPTFLFPAFENQGDPWDIFTGSPDNGGRINLSRLVEDSAITGFPDAHEQYQQPAYIDAIDFSPSAGKLYFVEQFHAGYPVAYHRFYYELNIETGETKQVAERQGGYGQANDPDAYEQEIRDILAFQQAHPHLAELDNRLTQHLFSPDRRYRLSIVNIEGLSWVQIRDASDPDITYQLPNQRSGRGRDGGRIAEIPFRLVHRENPLRNCVIEKPSDYAAWSPDSQWVAIRGFNDQKIFIVSRDFQTSRIYFEDATVGSIQEWRQQQPLSWETGEEAYKQLKYGSGNYFDNLKDLPLNFVTAGPGIYDETGQVTGPLKWSPDGSYLAYYTIRHLGDNAWSNDLFLLRVADGNAVRINHKNTCDARREHRYDLNFSPDGASLAFVLTQCAELENGQQVVGGWAIHTADIATLFAGDEFPLGGCIRPVDVDHPAIHFTGVRAGYTTPFAWVGEVQQEEKPGLVLVVPQNSQRTAELTRIKYRHDGLVNDLQTHEKAWHKDHSAGSLAALDQTRSDIIFAEKEFFEIATAAIDDYSWAEIDRQMQAFRDHAVDLQRDTTTTCDALGKYTYATYLTSYTQYSNEEKLYRYLQKQLLDTLNIWNAWNATLIKHHGMRAREIEVELRRHGLSGDPGGDMRPLCRRLAMVHLDQGERSIIQRQIMQEATFLAQRSYFYGLRAARDAHEQIHPTTTTQQVQELFFKHGKYFVTTTSGIWSGVIDLLKITYVPDSVREWIGLETLAEKTDREIKKLREEISNRIAAVDMLRTFSDDQFIELRHYLRDEGGFFAEIEKGLVLLRDDRDFHEGTDGGLFRIAGAFDTTLTEKLATEYLAASKHGSLSLADLQTSLNKQIGLTESGEFTFKLFISPMSFVESMSRSLRGEWEQKGQYIGVRQGMVSRMQQLFTFWRDRDFAFEDFEFRTVKKEGQLTEVPTTVWQNHQEMLYRYPDYMQFMLRRQALLYDYQQMELAVERELCGSSEEAEQLQHLQELKGFVFELRLQPLMARTLKLEGVDRILCRDYQSGLAKLKLAARTDPSEMDPQELKLVESELTGMQIREEGISVFRNIGDTTAYALLLGRITNGAGFTPNFAFNVHGFANYVWMQACPFDGFTSIEGMFRIWLNATKAVTAQALSGAGVKALDATGVDGNYYRPFIGKLAVVLTEMGARQVQEASYPILERSFGRIASRLTRTIEEMESEQQNGRTPLPRFLQRSRLAERLIDYVDVVKAIKQLRDYSAELRRIYQLKNAQAAVLRGRVTSIEEFLFQKTSPLTSVQIMRALRTYNNTSGERFNPDAAIALFRQLPIKKLRAYKQNRSFFRRNQGIELQLDAIRCQLCNHARQEVARQYQDYVLYIAPSGTPPGNSEYRYLDSDNDYTFLLRPDVEITDAKRAEIEAAYSGFFSQRYGINEEQLGVILDSFAFSDVMPDPAKIRDASQYMQQFRRNRENPERYILPGTIKFIPLFLFRKAGILQKLEGGRLVPLSAAETDRIFGHIELRDHHAADIMHDQMRFIEQYWQDYRGGKIDVVKYLKAQGKYSLRALLAYNLTVPRGVELHNAFVPGDSQSFHQAIRDIARQVYPDDAELQLLASEWYLLKTGRPVETVFRQRMVDNNLDLAAAAQQHIARGAEAMGRFIAKAVPLQQQYMQAKWTELEQLRSAHSIEQIMAAPDMREQYMQAEYEYYSAVVSNGWVLSRLSPAEKAKLLSANPAAAAYLQPQNKDVRRIVRYYQAEDREGDADDAADLS